MDDALHRNIARIVGKQHCFRNAADMDCYGYDASAWQHRPDVVAFPGTAREVAALITLAHTHGLPVTPRGSGTGTTGGCLPAMGGLVVATRRLNRILDIDARNLVAHVEPGVLTGTLQAACAAQGLYYPPDPASAAYATIGGNLAECAGGPGAVKYGVTRDYVLGLEAVIGTGECIRTGVQTVKGVVGYDLTRLLVGSEGTLGIITRATLRLVPKPEAVGTMAAVFEHMRQGAETVSDIIRKGIVPRTIEFLDNPSVACIRDKIPFAIPPRTGALLLIEADGTTEEVKRAMEGVNAVCAENSALAVLTADSPQEADRLWQARKLLSPAMYQYGPDKINEDIVVPRNSIPDMLQFVERLQVETGLTMICFGHAGDGNIHFHIMLDKSVPEDLERAEAAVDRVFDQTLKLGGTISGEHGVGLSKKPYLSKEIGRVEQALMKQIKSVFDPKGILNPGKIFP